MSAYNMMQQKERPEPELLSIAFDQIRERIIRARELQQRLLMEDPNSKYVSMSKAWETIGMDRLTLCHIAAGDTVEALQLAEETQRMQTTDDPTVRAFSRFYYGNALWSSDRRNEALQQWNSPNGTCASPMAFCKEPAAEYVEYVNLMAQAGVNFDTYDEQGFSALDYAVFSDTEAAKQMIEIIVDALRKDMHLNLENVMPRLPDNVIVQMVNEEITTRLREAQLRRAYRAVFQEHIRPELRTGNGDSIEKLRTVYADLLVKDLNLMEMFDAFRYVKYTDFKRHGRLPLSTDNLSISFPNNTGEITDDLEDQFIIFCSYRWIGPLSDPPREGPDDDDNTQWRRMINAVDGFLQKHRSVNPEWLGLWLVSASL